VAGLQICDNPGVKNALLIAVLMTSTASAGDWPQLLGPQRNGVAENETIAAAWPAGGPRVVWSVKVGHGWAGPAVSGGKVVIFHRVGDNDVVEALSADKGQKLWSHSYAADYHDDFGFDPGPRATPTIDGDRVYTHGAQGLLHCFDLATGKVIWSVDTAKQFSSEKGFFGRAGSPLIEGDKLLLNIGAHGAAVAAFDKHTGKLLWKAGDDEAGYSSPTAATINGKRHALFFTRTGLLDVNPDTGHIDADLRWRSEQDASVNAAVPIVVGSRVCSSRLPTAPAQPSSTSPPASRSSSGPTTPRSPTTTPPACITPATSSASTADRR
jgi:outer membrane protein assembly factor BamB